MEYHKIPGVLDDKTNCRIHYAHVASVFIILVIMLVIVSISGSMIYDVSNTVSQTKELISDMNELMPEARLAIDIVYMLCDDKNFTKWYPTYADKLCNSTI